MDIFDLNYNEIQYPSKEELLHGLPRNTGFSDISKDYLNGLIGYTDNIETVLVKYYSVLKAEHDENSIMSCWEDIVKNFLTKIADGCHPDFSNEHVFPERDDILVLSESENDYWVFWYHNSGRNDMFRFDKNSCEYGECELKKMLYKAASLLGDGYYQPLGRLSGWIKY